MPLLSAPGWREGALFVLELSSYRFIYRLASLVGTLPAGGSFCPVKRNQNPLRAFPPKYPPGVRGCPCVKAMSGPLPLLWPLLLPPHQATRGSWPYRQAVSTSGPTLEKRRSRRREPGCPSLGTAAYQGKALEVEVIFVREIGAFRRISTPSM